MPVTWAPATAMLSARIPPPQPTSSTSSPSREPTFSWIQPSRNGLITCRGLNSLSGSHQRDARALNFSSSDGSTLTEGEDVATHMVKASGDGKKKGDRKSVV